MVIGLFYFFYYLFSGEIGQAFESLWDIITRFFTDFIADIFRLLWGFVLEAICLCEAWQTFDPEQECENQDYCSAKKRYFGEEEAIESIETVVAPDWVGNTAFYVWPAGDHCSISIPSYRAKVLSNVNLTAIQKEEVAYCTARLTLFNNKESASSTVSAMDQCGSLVRKLEAANKAWPTIDLMTQTFVLKCIAEHGTIAAMKRESKDATLDWLPNDVFAAGGLKSLVLANNVMQMVLDGLKVAEQRSRDKYYDASVTQSDEYRAAVAENEGEMRAAVLDAVNNGVTMSESLNAYVAANVETPTRLPGVASFVRFFELVKNTASAQLPSRMVAMADKHMTTMPNTTSTTDANTSGAFISAAESNGIDDEGMRSAAIYREVQTLTHRTIKSGWKVLRAVWSGNSTNVQSPKNPFEMTMTKKRVLTVRPPINLISALWNATKGAGTLLNELWTGAARQNATMEIAGSRPTIVQWHINPDHTAFGAVNFKQDRVWNTLVGPFVTRMRVRFNALSAMKQQHDLAVATYPDSVLRRQRMASVTMPFQAASVFSDLLLEDPIPYRNTTLECLTTFDFCQDCLILDNWLGYAIYAIDNFVKWATGSEAASPSATLVWAHEGFTNRSNYIADMDAPVIVGDSPTNPVRWPYLDRSSWALFRDNDPYKIGITDLQPLLDDTVALINEALGDQGLLAGLEFAGGDEITANVSSASMTYMNAQGVVLTRAQWRNLTLPRRLRNGGDIRPLAQYAFDSATMVLPALIKRIYYGNNETEMAVGSVRAALNFNSTMDLALAWFDFIDEEVRLCDRTGTELYGEKKRFSLGEVFVSAVLVSVLVVLIFGTIWPGFISLILGPFGLLLLSFVGMLILVITYGWSFNCSPSLPVQLGQDVMYAFMHSFVTRAPVYVGAMILETTFTPENSAACELYSGEDREFHFGSCVATYGWDSWADPIVFPLRFFFPEGLEYLKQAKNFPFPLNVILGGEFVQERLVKWDDVDLENDSVTYAAHLHCWPILTVYYLVFLVLAAKFLGLGVTTTAIGLVFSLAGTLITAAFLMSYAVFMSFFTMNMLSIATSATSYPMPGKAGSRKAIGEEGEEDEDEEEEEDEEDDEAQVPLDESPTNSVPMSVFVDAGPIYRRSGRGDYESI